MEKTCFPEQCKNGRGTMWRYVALSEPENYQKMKKCVFHKMKKITWHYVALSEPENFQKKIKNVLQKNAKMAMALCGAIGA